MHRNLRTLALLAFLVALTGGVEYFTAVDIPGFDLNESGLSIPKIIHVDELPGSGRTHTDRVESESSSGQRNVESRDLHIASWNLYNFGRTKDTEEIGVAADVLRTYDLVAVQEVVTSPPGAQAIAQLDAALDRRGFEWDYRISDPTSGKGTERYAFLWKPSRVRMVGKAWLASSLADRIDREPYLARFEHRHSGQRVLVASFHAVPRSKNPDREIALLDLLHTRYEDDHVVLAGDFNLDEDDAAFEELRTVGYRAVLDDRRTSLRRTRDPGPRGHLANEYDNIFIETGPLHLVRSGTVDFTPQFSSLTEARSLSDHLPVYATIQWTAPCDQLAP